MEALFGKKVSIKDKAFKMINEDKIERLRNMLEDLITPKDENETRLFKEKCLVDDYIAIKNKIPEMSEQELVDAINIQLAPYNLQIDKY